MRNTRSLLLAFTLVTSSVGCIAAPAYMRPAPAAQPSATDDSATIVFIRPSGYGGVQTFLILDERGEFVGESAAKSWFSTRVKPGKHLFIGVGENTAPLVANVEAGRLYFVEVASKMGWLNGPRVHLLRLAPGTENWPHVATWLTESKRYEPIGAVSIDAAEREKRVFRAREHLSNYSMEKLVERTLRVGDGITTFSMK